MGFKNHIAVNLNQAEVGMALSKLADFPKQRLKVKTAHVHAVGPVLKKDLSRKGMLEIFRAIGNLPNLTLVVVDLNYLIALPVQAMILLLRGLHRLKSVEFSRLRFTGDLEDIEELSALLKTKSRLQSVNIWDCRGPLVSQALVLEPPALRRIEINACSINYHCNCSNSNCRCAAVTDEVSTKSLAKILQRSPCLEALSLINLPNDQISDAHVKALTAELSWKSSRLSELTIESSWLSKRSGEAISHMMLMNESIRILKLHIDWEDCGPTVANMLRLNSTLSSLDLRFSGDEDNLVDNVVEVAKSLHQTDAEKLQVARSNVVAKTASSLKKLRLCFEFEPKLFPQKAIDAFSNALETNDTLGTLILTDTIEKCSLPVPMRTKLRLNRLGVPQLLRYDAATSTGSICSEFIPTHAAAIVPQHAGLVEAMIAGRNDIDVNFYILSNYPIMLGPNEGKAADALSQRIYSSKKRHTNRKTKSTELQKKQERFQNLTKGTNLVHAFLGKQRSFKGKRLASSGSGQAPALGRRIMSFLAPSA